MLLAYHRWHKLGKGTRIIFLHGMGGTGALWRPLGAVLEENYDVLAPDQRGHGRSQIPHISGSRDEPTYTPLDYGRDLTETMEKEEFHPAWIVGHSMGVRSACAAAHLKPEWVKGLVLIDLGFAGVAGGGLGEDLAAFIKKLPTRFESRSAMQAFMREECPDPAIGQYLMAVSKRDEQGGQVFPFDHGALVQTVYAARDSSVGTWVEELGQRGMPILVLRGTRSEVWTHEEFEAERARFSRYPSIKFIEMEGTGHGLPFEKRLEFLEILKDFTRSG